MWNYDYSNTYYYSIDLQTKAIERLSDLKYSKESYAQINSDGKKMIYLSDKNGITNIYMREIDSSGNFTDKPITNALNPIDQLSLSKDGKKLLFVSLNKGGYDIFSMDNPLERNIGLKELELTDYQKKSREYDVKFGKKLYTLNGSDQLISDSIKIAVKNDSMKKSSDYFITDPGKVSEDSSMNYSYIDSANSKDSSVLNSANLKSESNDSTRIDSSKYYGEDVKIRI